MLFYLLLLLFAAYLLCRYLNKLLGLPPGPTPLPLLGNLLSLPFEGIDALFLKLKKQYGGVYTLWMPTPIVVLTDYEMMKRTIVKNGEAFAGRPNDSFLVKLLVQGNYGLVFEENDWYKSQRRFTLHTLRNLGVGQSAIKDTILAMCHRMIRQLKETNGEPIDIRDYLTNSVGNVIHQLAYGYIRPEGDKEIVWFQRAIVEVFERFSDPKMALLDGMPFLRHFDGLLGLNLKSAVAANDEIVDFLKKQVAKHKSLVNYEEEPTNYIDAYLHEIRKRELEGIKDEFTELQLAMAVYDLYGAGFETITVTLRYAFLYLLNYPEVQKRIHEEIDANIGHERDVSMDDQKVLPYTCAYIQEVYRLGYVLVMNLMRTTMEDVDCEGYHIKAGTKIIPQFQSVHMDPEQFPNPSLMLPERHLKDGQYVKDDRITPFSIGKRACLGENLARMEVFMFFVSQMQQFKFAPEGTVPPEIASVTSAFRAPVPYKLRAISRH